MENFEQKSVKMEIKINVIKSEGRVVTRIVNSTPYSIMISEKPVPPKRKPKDLRLIRSKEFFVMDGQELDFERIYLSFVNK